ncbi:hypothetical protein ABPG72_009751 [Tetrahymena utriculariae]
MSLRKVDTSGQCKVCYEQISDNFFLSANCCNSQFHYECLQECFNAQLNHFSSKIKCPNFDCNKDITDQDIEANDLNKLSQLKISQIQRKNTKIQPIKDKNQKCDICIEVMDVNTLMVLGCNDKYHKICLEEYFKVEIQQKKLPIKCPNQSCQYQIQPLELKQILKQKDYEKYEQFQFQNYVDYNKSQVFQRCFTPNCQYLFIKDSDLDKFDCPSCFKQYCLICQCKYHTNQTCKEYQISTKYSKQDEEFDNLAKENKFKQCSKCKMYVEKNEGCDHITCRCSYEFCYKCGGPHNNCECTKRVELVNQQTNTINQRRNSNQIQQLRPNNMFVPIRQQQDNQIRIPQASSNQNQQQFRQLIQQEQSQTNRRNQISTNRNQIQQQSQNNSQQIISQNVSQIPNQIQNNINSGNPISVNRNQIQQQYKNNYIGIPYQQQTVYQNNANHNRSISQNRNQIGQQNQSKSQQQNEQNDNNYPLNSVNQNQQYIQSNQQLNRQQPFCYQQSNANSDRSISQNRNQIQQQNSANSQQSRSTRQNNSQNYILHNPVSSYSTSRNKNQTKLQKENNLQQPLLTEQKESSNNSLRDRSHSSNRNLNRQVSQNKLQQIKSTEQSESQNNISKNTNHKYQMSLNIDFDEYQNENNPFNFRPSEQIQYYSTKHQNNTKFNNSKEQRLISDF